jgi:ankyrin repeat protein
MNKLFQYLIASYFFTLLLTSCSYNANMSYKIAQAVHKQPNNADLQEAAIIGDKELMQHLLAKGCDPTIKDKFGATPLHYAAQHGHTKIIELLLENGHGLNPNIADQDGLTPLHYAAQYGHAEATTSLLAHHANPNIADQDGNMPLHLAAEKGDIQSVSALLRQKAIVNIPNELGDTPLHLATENDHLETVALLLTQPYLADPTLANVEDGYTPLHIAAKYGHKEILELFLSQLLPLNQIDINALDTQYGTTPLHLATQNGQQEVVKYLLQNGADPTITDNDRISPLHLGAQNGNLGIVELLLASVEKLTSDKKAYIDRLNEDHNTALHLAALQAHIPVIELLLQNGADIDIVDSAGYTALGLAIRYNRVEVIDLLLKNGADLKKIEHIPYIQPLHQAASLRNVALIKSFLENGANVNMQDQQGCSFLHIIAAKKDFDMLSKAIQIIHSQHENLLNTLQTSNLDINLRDILPLIADYTYNIDWNLKNHQGESILNILEMHKEQGSQEAEVVYQTIKAQKMPSGRKRKIELIEPGTAHAQNLSLKKPRNS